MDAQKFFDEVYYPWQDGDILEFEYGGLWGPSEYEEPNDINPFDINEFNYRIKPKEPHPVAKEFNERLGEKAAKVFTDAIAPDKTEEILKIKKEIPLVPYVEQFQPIWKTGRYYKADCLFCGAIGEQTAVLYPEKNTFYCYNCQKGGDIISFYGAWFKCDEKEAIEKLSEVIIKERESENPLRNLDGQLTEEVLQHFGKLADEFCKALMDTTDSPGTAAAKRVCDKMGERLYSEVDDVSHILTPVDDDEPKPDPPKDAAARLNEKYKDLDWHSLLDYRPKVKELEQRIKSLQHIIKGLRKENSKLAKAAIKKDEPEYIDIDKDEFNLLMRMVHIDYDEHRFAVVQEGEEDLDSYKELVDRELVKYDSWNTALKITTFEITELGLRSYRRLL